MLASFVFCKICFVRQCAPLTMNYELLIAMCDRINHLKNWFVQFKNKSECVWMVINLLDDVLDGLKVELGAALEPLVRLLGGVLGCYRKRLGGSWELQSRSWVRLESSWTCQSDLGSILE